MPHNIDTAIKHRIEQYEQQVLLKLDTMKNGKDAKQHLQKAIKSANPYQLKLRFGENADPASLIDWLIKDQIAKSTETMFGSMTEDIAFDIAAHNRSYSLVKKMVKVDKMRVVDGESKVYLDEDKLSPHWGNSKSIAGLKAIFTEMTQTVGAQYPDHEIECINGCFYGTGVSQYDEYTKLCGQAYLDALSGEENFHRVVMGAMNHTAGFQDAVNTKIGEIIALFVNEFDNLGFVNAADGKVDWMKVVDFNSGV